MQPVTGRWCPVAMQQPAGPVQNSYRGTMPLAPFAGPQSQACVTSSFSRPTLAQCTLLLVHHQADIAIAFELFGTTLAAAPACCGSLYDSEFPGCQFAETNWQHRPVPFECVIHWQASAFALFSTCTHMVVTVVQQQLSQEFAACKIAQALFQFGFIFLKSDNRWQARPSASLLECCIKRDRA